MSTMKGIRLGEILVGEGLLTLGQVDEILAEQKVCGRPFGYLAEEMYSIRPEDIEKAWIEQYLHFGTEVDLDQQRIDTETLRVLNRRQAWQFRMLPLRRDEDELMVATSKDHLPRRGELRVASVERPGVLPDRPASAAGRLPVRALPVAGAGGGGLLSRSLVKLN